MHLIFFSKELFLGVNVDKNGLTPYVVEFLALLECRSTFSADGSLRSFFDFLTDFLRLSLTLSLNSLRSRIGS